MDFTVEMVMIECYKCHCQFGMTKELNHDYLNDSRGESFWCPQGHKQQYVGKSEAQQLRDELTSTKRNCTYYENKTRELREDVTYKDSQINGHKGAYAKLKKKVEGETQ